MFQSYFTGLEELYVKFRVARVIKHRKPVKHLKPFKPV